MCDSDESDSDDPYIACAEYVEQYIFDDLEGMELKVFNRWRESEGTGLTHVWMFSRGNMMLLPGCFSVCLELQQSL